MLLVYGSILLAVASGVLYHVTQKLIASDGNPFAQLMIAYACALVICFLGWQWSVGKGGLQTLPSLFKWSNVLLGAAIVGIELGYLLIYKSGWNLGITSVFVSGGMVLLLLPISLIFFKDSLTPMKVMGAALCFIGIFMMAKAA